jgi:hypothetical protein
MRALARLASLLLAGCTTVVTPPPAPADPVQVIVTDYGRHSSLLLPRADGTLAEYAYGEWRWFALLESGWWRVPEALLWPTQGTLGRRTLSGPSSPEVLRSQISVRSLHPVTVERSSAVALLAWLDARWESRAESKRHNATYGLDFVPDEDGFWLAHTCNAAVAEWLAAMGCGVSSPGWVAQFEIRPTRSHRSRR